MKLIRMLVLALLTLACGSAFAQAIKLKFAIFTPDKEQTFITVFKPFADAVNKEGKGLVEIELYPNGALGRIPPQQAQMILDGVSDIGWVVASYTPGRFQDNEVLELPGMFRDLKEATTVFTRLVNSGQIKGFEDYVPLGTFGAGPYSFHARFPINTIADLKGKKMRASGAVETATVRALGGVPIGMPITEVAEAISRGTVDRSSAHPSVLFDFGIARVTTSHYFTTLGYVPVAILMNRKKFESLPKAAQDVIRKHGSEWNAANWNAGISAYNATLVKQLQEDPKRKVVFPAQSDAEAAQQVYKAVINEWTAKSARNMELYKIVEAEVAKVRAGR